MNFRTKITLILCRQNHGDGQVQNSRVFNFAILLKSRKFDAREIYMFYITANLKRKICINFWLQYPDNVCLNKQRTIRIMTKSKPQLFIITFNINRTIRTEIKQLIQTYYRGLHLVLL